MIIACNMMIFIFLATGVFLIISWLWEVGVQEILIYTENFLLEEAKRLRVRVLPEITSEKLLDRLELLLFYSGIRNYFTFVSGKVWLIFCMMVALSSFFLISLFCHSIWYASIVGIAICFLQFQGLKWLRYHNLRATEKQLLELLNITESFALTGEEPLAILQNCSIYMTGPIGHALQSIEKHIHQGWSGRMILEQLKVMLEHPKWQEFIHNLNVCSMYNSDYSYVFRSSRKSIQYYLSSKKERQSIKHTAWTEMIILVFMSGIILVILSKFLDMSVSELLWGNLFAKGCTIYMVGIIFVFFAKIGAYEKE